MLYAVSVGHLADRIQGKPAFVKKYREKTAPFTMENSMEVQKILAELKLYNGEIDGVLGRRSREAVRRFQKMYDLPEDGYANASLLEFMRLVINGEVEQSELTFDEIVDLQKILSKGQYYKGPIDGKLGKTTQQGIDLFKKVYGIRSEKTDRRLLEKMKVQHLRNMENGEIDPLVKEFRRREELRLREEMKKKRELARKKAMERRRREEERKREERQKALKLQKEKKTVKPVESKVKNQQKPSTSVPGAAVKKNAKGVETKNSADKEKKHK